MSIIEGFIYSVIFGAISNQVGAIIGFYTKGRNKNGTNQIISFTAGITTAIICFELLQEAFNIGNKYMVVLNTIFGIVLVKIIEIIINILKGNKKGKNSLVIASAMSAHNITEGIAIGSAFALSSKLGISLLIAIMFHNIPEGIIIGITSKKEKRGIKYILNVCNIIGIFLGIGSIIGKSIGGINSYYISFGLAISAGAMLYIVACELMPEINNNNKFGIGYIIGFLIGCIMCNR